MHMFVLPATTNSGRARNVYVVWCTLTCVCVCERMCVSGIMKWWCVLGCKAFIFSGPLILRRHALMFCPSQRQRAEFLLRLQLVKLPYSQNSAEISASPSLHLKWNSIQIVCKQKLVNFLQSSQLPSTVIANHYQLNSLHLKQTTHNNRRTPHGASHLLPTVIAGLSQLISLRLTLCICIY